MQGHGSLNIKQSSFVHFFFKFVELHNGGGGGGGGGGGSAEDIGFCKISISFFPLWKGGERRRIFLRAFFP